MRKADGTLIALSDRCPHRWSPLSIGRIEGETIRCMYHGLRFATDGRCVEAPGQENAPTSLRTRSFPVVERHKWTWIWMGEADKADPSLVPSVPRLDEDWRRVNYGQLDYEANHAFVMDNLLDLSHISYTHENTLGLGGFDWSADQAMHSVERGLYFDTWSKAGEGASIVQPRNGPQGDIWMRYSYFVPGLFISEMGTFPAGTAEAANGGGPPPGAKMLTDSMSCQAVTPINENKSRYFFSAGPRAAEMSEAETDKIWEITMRAFQEDKIMLEAQQRMITQFPGERMGGIAFDRGPNMFRRIMERLIAAENIATAANMAAE